MKYKGLDMGQKYKKFFKDFDLPRIQSNLELEQDSNNMLEEITESDMLKNLLLITEKVIKVDAYQKLLKNLFKQARTGIQKKNMSVIEICQVLNDYFVNFKIFFILKPIDPTKVYANIGLNKADTSDDEYSTITVHLNENCAKFFNLYIDKYIDRVLILLNHELIHREQAIRMKSQEIITKNYSKQYKDKKEYLSDPQEIMSFSYNIVEELRLRGWDYLRIHHGLTYFDLDSVAWHIYINNFSKDSDTIKKIIKSIYSYIAE